MVTPVKKNSISSNKDELEDLLLGFLSLTIVAQVIFSYLMFEIFSAVYDSFSVIPVSNAWKNLFLIVPLFLIGEYILLFWFYKEIKALKKL